MSNPFTGRSSSIGGPATDIVPVTPDDAADLADVAIALYVENAGAVAIQTVAGDATRVVNCSDSMLMPVGVRRVLATGTTATGIHALVLR